jgi:hypothetical protein
MQEVTLQTSNFSPEYGQVGGGLINLTAKSGLQRRAAFHKRDAAPWKTRSPAT